MNDKRLDPRYTSSGPEVIYLLTYRGEILLATRDHDFAEAQRIRRSAFYGRDIRITTKVLTGGKA